MHLPPDRPEVHLQRGPVQLSVCPTLGGAITRLRFDGVDVLRAWDGSDNGSCRDEDKIHSLRV